MIYSNGIKSAQSDDAYKDQRQWNSHGVVFGIQIRSKCIYGVEGEIYYEEKHISPPATRNA